MYILELVKNICENLIKFAWWKIFVYLKKEWVQRYIDLSQYSKQHLKWAQGTNFNVISLCGLSNYDVNHWGLFDKNKMIFNDIFLCPDSIHK